MSKIRVEETEVLGCRNPGPGYYSLTVAPFSKIKSIKPGQFIHVKIPHANILFRRAFSVYDVDFNRKAIDIIFKVVGRGTTCLTRVAKGDMINILGPLGNGFKFPSKSETIILIAGGIGMPPLYFLVKKLIEKGYDKKNILFYYGGNSKTDLVDLGRVKKLGVEVHAITIDGSVGYKGLVTEAVQNQLDNFSGRKRIFSCGPTGMLKAVEKLALDHGIPGQLSFEAPMPCGVGICLGCILPLSVGGYTRVCRDGPVYEIGEILL